MKCDFDYCIYNKNCDCYFDEIAINSLGICEECIIVSLPEEKLQEYKKNQLQETMSRYENYD